MLILCDFDGTITLEDVTNALLDHFTGRIWRETVLLDYRAGRINHLGVMQGSYAYLKTPLTEVLEFSRQDTQIRPNFEKLVSFCREQNYPLAVVSGGLDFYIKEFLPPGIPFHSYLGAFDEAEGVWRVNLPDWPQVDISKEDFKVRVLEELRREHPADVPAVFIGDGRNDGPVAQHADLVFAVRGSYLTRICAERGQPFIEFEDFAEVIAALHERRF